jgi:2-dehydrotetronate isomerase
MPKFAANLSWLYQELPFLDRFDAAARSHFKAVEFLFPYSLSPNDIVAKLTDNGLTAVLFNLPPGDFDRGERGLAALPGREHEFKASVEEALTYAETLQVRCLHVMAGITQDIDSERAQATYLNSLSFILDKTRGSDLMITIEPINNRDFPGYFLTTPEQAAGILDVLRHPRLRLQLDWYHLQIMGGDLTKRTIRFLPQVGHIQVAGVPERNEPDRGEVNFPHLFRLVDQLGYQGWIGCEYKPSTRTEAGLNWLTSPNFAVPNSEVGRSAPSH